MPDNKPTPCPKCGNEDTRHLDPRVAEDYRCDECDNFFSGEPTSVDEFRSRASEVLDVNQLVNDLIEALERREIELEEEERVHGMNQQAARVYRERWEGAVEENKHLREENERLHERLRNLTLTVHAALELDEIPEQSAARLELEEGIEMHGHDFEED